MLTLVSKLIERCRRPDRSHILGAIERADLEGQVSEWLAKHGIEVGHAAALIDGGVNVEALQLLVPSLAGATLAAVVRWIAAVTLEAP